MKPVHRTLVAALAGVLLAGAALAAPASPKDIVIDRVQASATRPAGAAALPSSDAMAVSVLLESAEGTLTPRSTAQPFRTGDRFRVKVVAARDGFVALYNTKPNGETPEKPVWRGVIKTGEELITPRLRLDGQTGEDLLHVVLEPVSAASQPGATAASGVWAWLRAALGLNDKGVADKSARKDIVLDSQSTPTTTYVVNPRSDGLTTTIAIRHDR